MVKVGIIGGSGLDNPDIIIDAKDIVVDTRYGAPSSALKTGRIAGVDVVLLARHGREHTIPPTQVNFRANIEALRQQGVTHILATTACGSLREDIGRGDFVILDQFIDFTRHRHVTFHDSFKPHNASHTAMPEPFSDALRSILIRTASELGLKHHTKGTVITIEGPRFSTKAESKMFRVWGADVINMSIAPEAALANEAGIPYAAVAMSTDYDCWKEDEAPVTWDEIVKTFGKNVQNVTSLLVGAIPLVSELGRDSIKGKIRTVPHFPKQGVMFRDITTLLKDSNGLREVTREFVARYSGMGIDLVAGIESRGFILGATLAHELGVGFVPIRKKGKLPAEKEQLTYKTEYSTDTIEVHKDSISPGNKVLLVDDLVATGGSALAAAQLIEKLGGKVVEVALVVDLPDLGGKKKLENAGYKVFTLVEFEGE